MKISDEVTVIKYIKAAGIVIETEVLRDHCIGFEEKFRAIGECTSTHGFFSEGVEEPAAEDFIDAGELYIVPGLIDVHVHGSGGHDTMEGTAEALETISRALAGNGVTGFLATTMTMSMPIIHLALTQIGYAMKRELPGAQVLGAHMEGPFINPKFKGAQSPEFILAPEWKHVEPYRDIVKLITLAPEMPGATEFIGQLKEAGIIISMGHTAATLEEAMTGIKAGVSHCTHLFNAMSGIHHREAGAAAAALSSDITCELIADRIHVHTGLYPMILKAKGVERLTLITDCIEAGGMPDGLYSLGGQPVKVEKGEARLEGGALAGSVLQLNRGLQNFYRNADLSLPELFRLASLNPAKELGMDGSKGSIAIGKDADFSLMDKDFNVKATYVKGKLVYHA